MSAVPIKVSIAPITPGSIHSDNGGPGPTDAVIWPPCPKPRVPVNTHGKAAPCSKHGGEIEEPCSTGAGKANLCAHSRWEKFQTFDGPCACHPCHDWPGAQKSQP